MRLKLRAHNISLSYISLWYLLLLGMIARYTEKGIYWFLGAICIIIIPFLIYFKKVFQIMFNRGHLWVIITELVCLVSNMILEINYNVIYSNLLNLLFPICIGFMLVITTTRNADYVKRFLDNSYIVINLWWVFNLIVITIQNQGNPLFIKSEWMNKNLFYPDLCCGLFGFNGTHELAFFSCFVLVLNLYRRERTRKNTQKNLILLYTLVTEVYGLYLSIYNDNKVLFILLPIVLIMYIYMKARWKGLDFLKRLTKYFRYLLLALVCILFVLQFQGVQDALNTLFFSKLAKIVNYRQSESIYGGNERLAIITTAINLPSTWYLGKGIGSSLWIEEGVLGYAHYGLNSMGSLLHQMGIWFFLLHTILFSSICFDVTFPRYAVNRAKGGHHYKFLIIALVIGITTYSPIFTSYTASYWLFMLFFSLGGLHLTIMEKKNGKESFNSLYKSQLCV